MKETMKEKRIRYFLIIFFIFITAAAIFFRNDTFFNEETDNLPKALVLKQSFQNKNPVIALYEFKNNEHVLAIYEVEIKNRFKFKTVHAAVLQNAPDQLSPDRNGRGFWTKVKGDWLYFTLDLQKKKGNPANRVHMSPFKSSFHVDKDGQNQLLIINENQTIKLSDEADPIDLHSLSADGSLWLVLTDKGVKIAVN